MLQVRLKIVGGKHAGKSIPLTTQKFLIGRGEDCQLRPNSELVSRHHCAITVDEFSVRLRDLGSTNGTFVNQERIRGQVVLNAGDQVRIGKLEVEIQITEVMVPEAEAPAPIPILSANPEPAPAVGSETAELSSSETIYEMPALGQTGDSTVIQTAPPQGDTAIIAPGMLPPPQQAPNQYAPQGQFIGYPPQPGYPPQQQGYGQPMPYPGQYPGMPMGGGYPQFPYGAPQGYPQQPMYPPQQGSYPPQQQGPGQNRAQSMNTVASAPTRIPEPGEIAAPLAHVPPPPQTTDPAAPKADNPSDRAAAIIRQHMQRRPG